MAEKEEEYKNIIIPYDPMNETVDILRNQNFGNDLERIKQWLQDPTRVNLLIDENSVFHYEKIFYALTNECQCKLTPQEFIQMMPVNALAFEIANGKLFKRKIVIESFHDLNLVYANFNYNFTNDIRNIFPANVYEQLIQRSREHIVNNHFRNIIDYFGLFRVEDIFSKILIPLGNGISTIVEYLIDHANLDELLTDENFQRSCKNIYELEQYLQLNKVNYDRVKNIYNLHAIFKLILVNRNDAIQDNDLYRGEAFIISLIDYFDRTDRFKELRNHLGKSKLILLLSGKNSSFTTKIGTLDKYMQPLPDQTDVWIFGLPAVGKSFFCASLLYTLNIHFKMTFCRGLVNGHENISGQKYGDDLHTALQNNFILSKTDVDDTAFMNLEIQFTKNLIDDLIILYQNHNLGDHRFIVDLEKNSKAYLMRTKKLAIYDMAGELFEALSNIGQDDNARILMPEEPKKDWFGRIVNRPKAETDPHKLFFSNNLMSKNEKAFLFLLSEVNADAIQQGKQHSYANILRAYFRSDNNTNRNVSTIYSVFTKSDLQKQQEDRIQNLKNTYAQYFNELNRNEQTFAYETKEFNFSVGRFSSKKNQLASYQFQLRPSLEIIGDILYNATNYN